MSKSLKVLMLGLVAALGLALLSPMGAATAATKIDRHFTRVTYTDGLAGTWYGNEVVKASPGAGNKRVYLQVKINNKWVNYVRETTLANGQFEFGNFDPRVTRRYHAYYYNVHPGCTTDLRVVVPGNTVYKRLVSPVWRERLGGC